ncbi:hypothetical protein [Glutamicibacter arilaitensis]|uniref:hypothetical protein n=1 Tax=Glutamicibacter arilaitensis TaxID=256701 RepID=UPI003FD29645
MTDFTDLTASDYLVLDALRSRTDHRASLTELSNLLSDLDDTQIRAHLSKLVDAGEVRTKQPADSQDPIYVVAGRVG